MNTRSTRNTPRNVDALLAALTEEMADEELKVLLSRELVRKAKRTAEKQARAVYRNARRNTALEALEAFDGNVKRAARETGIPESTLRGWRKEWEIPAFPDGAEAIRLTASAAAA